MQVPAASPPHPVFRVLVADDNHDLADTLGLLLGLAMDCEVEVVYDGAQALEHARASRPDAAIFDLEMPKVGGLDAAAGLKDAFPENPPFVIAMSGNPDALLKATPGSRSHAAVVDRAFCKPVDFDHLVDALAQAQLGAPKQDH